MDEGPRHRALRRFGEEIEPLRRLGGMTPARLLTIAALVFTFGVTAVSAGASIAKIDLLSPDGSSVLIDHIINIGRKLWTIVEENKPVVDIKTQYAAAEFPEGQYLQVEVAGVPTHAPHPELAHKFLDFMVSAKFQDVIPTTNWMFPVTATTGGLPSAFPSLPKKTLMIAPEDIAAHRKAWVDEWLGAMSE